MKNLLLTILVLFSLFLHDSLLAQNKNSLFYNEPATNWLEALPVGNGRLGAMVFGAYGEERIQLVDQRHLAKCPRAPGHTRCDMTI